MYRLITLGAADLLGPDGRRVNSVVQQQKRFLLLAYLALAPRGAPVRRDALLHLFWPESDDAQARHALKQAIYFLRRSLGSAAAVDGHDCLRIDAGMLSCDAREMEAALAGGDHRRALDLYRGEFLPSLFAEGCGEVQEWLEEQRTRYHQLAIEAARGLATAEQTRGNAAAAGHWGRRIAELAGASEPLMLEAMGLLVDCGDRAGAAELYAGFERRLEAKLEVGPSQETASRARRLLAAEHGRNGPLPRNEDLPRASADSGSSDSGDPLFSGDTVGPDHSDHVPAPDSISEAARGPAWIRPRAAAALLVILGLAMLVSWHASPARLPVDKPHNDVAVATITVRDFDHHDGDNEAAALAHAIVGVARRELAGVRGLVVVSPAPPQPAIAAAAAVRGRDRLEADAFDVRGSVRTTNDELRIELALWDTGSGRLVRALSLAHPAADAEGVVESLGRRIASAVRTEIGRERRMRITRSAVADLRAREAIQLAEDLIRRHGISGAGEWWRPRPQDC